MPKKPFITGGNGKNGLPRPEKRTVGKKLHQNKLVGKAMEYLRRMRANKPR